MTIASRLISHLERTNYVKPDHIAGARPLSEAVAVLQEAGLVLYHEASRTWVPDATTYNWLVWNKIQKTQTP